MNRSEIVWGLFANGVAIFAAGAALYYWMLDTDRPWYGGLLCIGIICFASLNAFRAIKKHRSGAAPPEDLKDCNSEEGHGGTA